MKTNKKQTKETTKTKQKQSKKKKKKRNKDTNKKKQQQQNTPGVNNLNPVLEFSLQTHEGLTRPVFKTSYTRMRTNSKHPLSANGSLQCSCNYKDTPTPSPAYQLD